MINEIKKSIKSIQEITQETGKAAKTITKIT